MVEVLATFLELTAAFAIIIFFSAVMTPKKKDYHNTLEPVRIPVRRNSNRH